MDRQQIIATAHEMADAARAAILPFFRVPGLEAENKLTAGFDPVTAADHAAERAMRSVLARRRPTDAILGEEFGAQEGTSGLTWVLDPIDGTRAFISGTPTWGVLIAVSDDSGPVYGMIDQPYIGERFEGGFGRASLTGPHGTMPLRTNPAARLAEAKLFTTFPEVGTEQDRLGFRAVAERARLVRYGMDCYGYALVALGQADLVIEAGLNAYDIQGPMAVIAAAGGIVTDWSGGAAHHGGRAVAAANEELHAEALELLNPYA
ncbi:Inositol monophosphatase family protein [Pseudooceanicola batsensis HTCC2597]|uniref:Inositol monophosphatase family protein n=1 Tax=Pseudooceanicola batsensis (strain ATCC BAA-863 / DSM 15984 / KCTC 12145 / HTCC2597) TaxID=252305 RepID=A3TVC6_PSEBH|nr:inositol monophosphatase family protein [Pseudooceanicola batsensis]EAQ04472.1 Inositol monophosphatase family protein [Pseudooceanicola batsensis HTCC2597]